MSDTPRATLKALLTPVLPKPWRVIYSERAADQGGTTLRLQCSKIRQHPAAGTGVHEIDFTATVTVAGEDLDRAEDDLDDELTVLAQALDDLHIRWSEWTKAVYDGALGYQSTLTLQSSKEL